MNYPEWYQRSIEKNAANRASRGARFRALEGTAAGKFFLGGADTNQRYEQKMRDKSYVDFWDYVDRVLWMTFEGLPGGAAFLIGVGAVLDLGSRYSNGPGSDLPMIALGIVIGVPLLSRAFRKIGHMFVLKRLTREQVIPYAGVEDPATTTRAQCPHCRTVYLEEPGKLITCTCGATLRIPAAA